MLHFMVIGPFILCVGWNENRVSTKFGTTSILQEAIYIYVSSVHSKSAKTPINEGTCKAIAKSSELFTSNGLMRI